MVTDIKNSIIYPLKDKQWLEKSWLLLLVPLIPIIALISPVLYKGWRLAMIKNLSQGNDKLPLLQPVDWFKNGAVLWLIWFSYLLLPCIVLALLGLAGPIEMIRDIFALLSSDNKQAWLAEQASEWMISFIVYVTWGLLAYPLYQAGVIRMALYGSWKSVFNLLGNTVLLMKHFLSFLKYYVAWLLIIVSIGMIDIFLSATGIGIFIIPLLTMVLYYVTTAFELGSIAKKVKNKQLT